MKQILNGRILTPEGWLTGGSVIVEDGKILEVSNNALHIEGAEIIDAAGGDIAPGGIELHIHGGGGRDFMEGSEEAFRIAVDAHLKHGTTAIFPTLSSSSPAMIWDAVHTCDKLMQEPGSPIMGLHLEGPYFNKAMAGAQMPEYITPPIPADYEPLLTQTNVIKRWDAAPELPGTEAFGRFCTAHGCLPAIAHTKGEYEDAIRALHAGFTHLTHFTNAMSTMHKEREYKKVGIVEAGYEQEAFTVEVIADGIHVPAPLLSMIWKIKGTERMALITDALAVAASDATEAFDPRVIIEDGVCKLADRSALAGSIATMDRLVRTAVQQAAIPVADALRMTAETPARIMGIYDRKGSLQRGKDADIVIYDNQQTLRFVMQAGKTVVSQL